TSERFKFRSCDGELFCCKGTKSGKHNTRTLVSNSDRTRRWTHDEYVRPRRKRKHEQHQRNLHNRTRLGSRDSGQSKRFERDRKSTRLNSSHGSISYAVFCLTKKTTQPPR